MNKAFFTRRNLILLGLGVIALGSLAFCGDSEDAKGKIMLVEVTTGNVREEVTAQGKLEPKEYVDIATQVSGQIKELHIDIGDKVKNGDLLAEVDPRVYESRFEANTAALKTLQAQLSEQKAQTALTRQTHDRYAELTKIDAISKNDWDTAVSNYKAALAREKSIAAQIEQQQSTLKGDETNLGFTKIYATMDGTVVTLNAKVGQTFNAVQSAPTILQLANLNVMTVRAQVAEADVMRLKPEMQASFSTLGDLNEKWQGRVRQILPSPQVVNDVVLYDVLIDVDNKDGRLMNGMSAQISFILAAADNVRLVPVSALTTPAPKPDNALPGTSFYKVEVRTAKDKPATRVIETGLADRTNAVLRGGLEDGDKIVITSSAEQPKGGAAAQGGGLGRGMRF